MKRCCKIFVFIFLMLLFPLNATATDGKLQAGDIEMECVYENGISVAIYYENGTYGMSASDFKLANAIAPPYSSKLTYFYNEAKFAEKALKSATCPEKIGHMVINQFDANNNTVTFQVFYDSDDFDELRCCKYNPDGTAYNLKFNEDFFKSNVVAGFEAVSGKTVTFTVMPDSPLFDKAYARVIGKSNVYGAFEFNLKSEKIYFNNDVEPKKQWAFKSEGEQVASNPNYIRAYLYTTENNRVKYFFENDQTITSIYDDRMSSSSGELRNFPDYTMFLCFAPSSKVIENDKNDMAYSFSRAYHNFRSYSVKNSKLETGNHGLECAEGYSLYREVEWEEVEDSGGGATSICDVIPETSLIIAKIINYSRIIVPVLLIVLTAVDITRIVISGDIAEELPKKKKLIIIRFIVALLFFFIPLFIQIIVSSNTSIDFGDISCLW